MKIKALERNAVMISLTLSGRRSLSYRNQTIDLLRKSMDWFLYDNGLRLERVNYAEWYHYVDLSERYYLSLRLIPESVSLNF